jgi:16S rRNA (guanine527-N7)-methyltransferase
MSEAGAAALAPAPPAPPQARAMFGSALDRAVAYAGLLAGDGVVRGLIGPREVPRLWDRHLLNCAVLGELLPADAEILDVGAGAGLPGIPLALARPDLRVTLLEPAQRRVQFLTEACTALGISERVEVARGRAEDVEVRAQLGEWDWVTARAVAPLDRLVRWCLPLLRPGGCLLALKGASVRAEIDRCERSIRAAGVADVTVREIGASLAEPTWVAVIRRASRAGRRGKV